MSRASRWTVPPTAPPLGVIAAALLLLALLGLLVGPEPSTGDGQGRLNPTAAATSTPRCAGADWPTYLQNVLRQADGYGETTISPSTASQLVPLWHFSTSAPVPASPAIVRGVAYVGSWNGTEYALNASTGHVVWHTFLGVDRYGNGSLGVTSSATVAAGVVYVGGGTSFVYALNATNGHVLWKVSSGNVTKGYYNWASPLVANGFAYLGVASALDAQVPGGLLQVSLATHHVVHFFNTTAPGVAGGSVWTSPTLATPNNTVYISTGNPNGSSSRLTEAIIALNATTLALESFWQVPALQATPDGDFGATPMLVTTAGGGHLVVASNKNGVLYAWNQSNVHAGPVWNVTVSDPSPLRGPQELGPTSLGGGRVYVGTSGANVSGTHFNGSVQALDPATGRILWQQGITAGPVLGAPSFADGVVIDAAGNTFEVRNATNGAVLYHYTTATKNRYWATPAVSHGEILIGARDGKVYAFGLNRCHPGLAPTSGLAGPLFRLDSVLGRRFR